MSTQSIVVVTGLSGSGKGTALRALEDVGYFCIDNLPVLIVPKMFEVFESTAAEFPRIAIAVDAREKNFLGQAPRIISEARAAGRDVQVLFLDCSDDALIRRFSETRRRHPLSPAGTVPEGIAAERVLTAELKTIADEVIDTTQTNIHELRQLVQDRFSAHAPDRLVVSVVSFGFRHGVPSNADIVLDVRFVPNPYYVPELRPLAGTSPAVSEWVLARADAKEFVERAKDLLAFLVPRYRAEGKAYLTVALGCTGGRHRSVALAEALGKALEHQGLVARVRHRDVERD